MVGEATPNAAADLFYASPSHWPAVFQVKYVTSEQTLLPQIRQAIAALNFYPAPFRRVLVVNRRLPSRVHRLLSQQQVLPIVWQRGDSDRLLAESLHTVLDADFPSAREALGRFRSQLLAYVELEQRAGHQFSDWYLSWRRATIAAADNPAWYEFAEFLENSNTGKGNLKALKEAFLAPLEGDEPGESAP